MASRDVQARMLRAALRLVVWILPWQRKEWAEAMLNEIAYVGSYWTALRWMLGSTLCAIQERASYELEKTFMSRRFLKAALGISAVLMVTMIGVYAIQKPYQRERIKLTLLHRVEASSAHHAKTDR